MNKDYYRLIVNPHNRFVQACIYGCLNIVKIFLPYATFQDLHLGLRAAISAGHLDIFHFLLRFYPLVDISLFKSICTSGNMKLFEYIYPFCDPDIIPELFSEAIRCRHRAMVKFIYTQFPTTWTFTDENFDLSFLPLQLIHKILNKQAMFNVLRTGVSSGRMDMVKYGLKGGIRPTFEMLMMIVSEKQYKLFQTFFGEAFITKPQEYELLFHSIKHNCISQVKLILKTFKYKKSLLLETVRHTIAFNCDPEITVAILDKLWGNVDLNKMNEILLLLSSNCQPIPSQFLIEKGCSLDYLHPNVLPFAIRDSQLRIVQHFTKS